jgi:hypothetical protein
MSYAGGSYGAETPLGDIDRNRTPVPFQPYQSVADYTAAKQAGDSAAASRIVRDAINRLTDGTISADEYNALIEATMSAGAR